MTPRLFFRGFVVFCLANTILGVGAKVLAPGIAGDSAAGIVLGLAVLLMSFLLAIVQYRVDSKRHK